MFQIASMKIGKGRSRLLREGNEISLGSIHSGPDDHYRWLYRHCANTNYGKTPTGGIWDNYDIGKELGRGTFANVYRAMQRSTGTWYAVKIIQRAKFRMNPNNETNFLREIDILTRLDHVSLLFLYASYFLPDFDACASQISSSLLSAMRLLRLMRS